ncbi:MAG: DUF3299 domain-containing protein [Gammaproteobacteria bacterium]|nr:DUF3299 domain-containing protein [Gammaproteobacteria bacterium]
MKTNDQREHRRRRSPQQSMATLTLVALLCSGTALASAPRTLSWHELTPPGWQSTPPDLSQFFHDPSAPAAPQDSSAPIVESLHDTEISIRGFVVPLRWEQDAISEFLFVPWFGACLHFPPPPPNQIIRVQMDRSLPEVEMFHPQILTGRLLTERSDSDLAVAGYLMVEAQTQRTVR